MRAGFNCAARFEAEALSAWMRAAGDRALPRAGELVRARAAALAPRRSGNLAASGSVEAGGGKAIVRFTAPYAAIQHERAEFRHPGGGQANYLRAAALDTAAEALSSALAGELGGR